MTTRTLKIAMAILLALFALYIFLYPPSNNNGLKNINDTSKNTSLEKNDKPTALCVDYNNYSPSTLQKGLISDMINIYRINQGNAINTNMLQQDAESVWFKLDTIKKFLYHLEKISENNGVSPDKLGLRLYYATYPSKTFWNANGYKDLTGFLGDSITEKYEKKHTIVMVPTININGKDTDFNPIDVTSYASGIKKLKSQFNGEPSTNTTEGRSAQMGLTGTNSATNSTGGEERIISRNHGNLIPPGDPSATGF